MRWTVGPTSGGSASASASAGNNILIDPQLLPSAHPPIPSTSTSRTPPPACPMNDTSLPPSPPSPSSSSSRPAQCPIQKDTASSSSSSLNPLNSIPSNLSATARSPGQLLDLPTDRTTSTIPRPAQPEGDGDEGPVWDYPSPQQFYNALVRKGWETPEDSVEMMVAIHNFLNERAWEEVMKWEKRLPGGEAAQLSRFQGRPGDISPKARLHLWASKVFPSRFNTVPPFDRHDWVVTRPVPSENPGYSPATDIASPNITPEAMVTTNTRYVIDYYSAPPDEEGNPVFHLDVRPALDDLQSVNQRIRVGLEEWMRGAPH